VQASGLQSSMSNPDAVKSLHVFEIYVSLDLTDQSSTGLVMPLKMPLINGPTRKKNEILIHAIIRNCAQRLSPFTFLLSPRWSIYLNLSVLYLLAEFSHRCKPHLPHAHCYSHSEPFHTGCQDLLLFKSLYTSNFTEKIIV
jgi:hypothetical protein